MPTTAQLRSRLVAKLKELFQLDQPDLDFGFYRIMHAKAKQVTEFLEKDLLKVIEDTFGHQADQQSASVLAAARRELEEALGSDALDGEGQLKEAFAQLPAGKRYLDALAKAEAAKDALSAEGEIYDHLNRFFERYYEDGDFISRRYFSRETAGRAAPFAIPYNGEEVKLHWANADQYYIKTGEYFANFTVDLAKAPELEGREGELGLESRNQPLPVHFRIVDAAEGEHGNVKSTESTKRFFILHADDPVGFNDKGELELRFEFRPDPEKPEKSQEGKWQEELRAQAVERLLATLAALPEAAAYHRLLAARAPTEANKDRTLLAKYLHQYTARNTADYFIHKDLGAFLRRELDFYIKNEVMRLDDIENEDAPRVESYLAKLKVLRAIARQLIAFLAQLEDFQKKLWLKKKFVVETNYCITLDRVPEELYPEIAANDAQREEWVKLYAIDEIEGTASGDLLQAATPGYSSPLTVEFLKSQPHLVLDTRHFTEDFKARVVASVEKFDEQCDGLLLNSENFQGLSLLSTSFHQGIDCIYIDPPYNTGKGDFAYKDSYLHSSWMSMIEARVLLARRLLHNESSLTCSIADHEIDRLRIVLSSIFGDENMLANFVWNNEGNIDNQSKVKVNHEYLLTFCKCEAAYPHAKVIAPDINESSKLFNSTIENSITKNGPGNPPSEITLPIGFPSSFEDGSIAAQATSWPHLRDPVVVADYKLTHAARVYSGWSSRSLLECFIRNECHPIKDGKGLKTWFKMTHTGAIYCYKERADQSHILSVIRGVGTVKKMSGFLASMGFEFSYPKPLELIGYVCKFTNRPDALIADFFAGSGTTGHAVINLNREDNGRRKYILIEMGDHFDRVLKPRIAKVVYSPDWKEGKPVTRDRGVSHCFKYVRLESYEDTLNNLRFTKDAERDRELATNYPLRRDYTLNYLLDVETRGSQSLLNLDGFADPTAYTLKVKKPGAIGSEPRPVDLIETFNFLIGLRLVHLAAPQRFTATFERVPDPDLPEGTDTRLQLVGKMRQSPDGAWWFRKVEGWVPKDRENPNNGQKEKVLIVWRTLTGNLEEDNLMLDEWFQKNRLSTRDFEFDTIYVNGSNNLPNLKLASDTWKVRLLEEEFHKAMWDTQDS